MEKRKGFETIFYNLLIGFLSLLITVQVAYPIEQVSFPWVTCSSTYYEVRHPRCPGPECGKIKICAYCVYSGAQCEIFDDLEHASTEIIPSSNDSGKEFLKKLVKSINKKNRGVLNLGLKKEILDMVTEYDAIMGSFSSGDGFSPDSLKHRNAYYSMGWLRDLMMAYLKTEKETTKQRVRVKAAISIQKTLIEMVSIDNILNVSTSLLPFVGDARDLYELSSGFDFVTGEKLTPFERILSGTGLLIGSGILFRTAIKKLTPTHVKALVASSGGIIDSSKKILGQRATKAIKAGVKKFHLKSPKMLNDFFVDLAHPKRRNHILNGEVLPNGSISGGHLFPGKAGKSVFPKKWSGDKIMHETSDIITDPNINWIQKTGVSGTAFTKSGKPARFEAVGIRDGVEIKIIVEPAGEGIITSFPLGGIGVIKNLLP